MPSEKLLERYWTIKINEDEPRICKGTEENHCKIINIEKDKPRRCSGCNSPKCIRMICCESMLFKSSLLLAEELFKIKEILEDVEKNKIVLSSKRIGCGIAMASWCYKKHEPFIIFVPKGFASIGEIWFTGYCPFNCGAKAFTDKMPIVYERIEENPIVCENRFSLKIKVKETEIIYINDINDFKNKHIPCYEQRDKIFLCTLCRLFILVSNRCFYRTVKYEFKDHPGDPSFAFCSEVPNGANLPIIEEEDKESFISSIYELGIEFTESWSISYPSKIEGGMSHGKRTKPCDRGTDAEAS